jgi:hypothetical protein
MIVSLVVVSRTIFGLVVAVSGRNSFIRRADIKPSPHNPSLLAKGRVPKVRGFVVGLFGEVSSDTLTLVRHCVDMIAFTVWKRSGFSSVSECCGVLLSHWRKKLINSCLRWRGTVDSHQSGGRWIWCSRWKAKENENI